MSTLANCDQADSEELAMSESVQNIESSFYKLMGRSPTPEEVRDLYRIKTALGLRADDPLWMILHVLRDFEGRYDAAADRIDAAAAQLKPISASRSSVWRLALVTPVVAFACFVTGIGMGLNFGQAPRVAEAVLNTNDQALTTCFHGKGRLEERADGTFCFPVSVEGKVFGYRVK